MWIGSFLLGHRLAPSCSFSEKKYLPDDYLSILSLLPETGGISGVTNKVRKMAIYIYIYIYIYNIYIYI